ncbi:phage Gp19/Gp15/Gp42 family protein [Globicatella sanguinis]|uniref:phage Gp19/Gp15/Gp42 family protein n=1 Tax=Globicatella sanguinis TaxID=13076 RepID=UPI00082602FB|nr:phage Gp19/Gp15/Gp42 family protein [Globicatella sanguinis]
MADFATLDELTALWRPMSLDEQTRAEALLPVVSDLLRIEADKVGIDLDQRALDSPSYSTVLKSVTVDIVARTLMTPTDKEPMVQESQSALGYSWSGTFLSPGGGLFIKNDELKRLGLRKQSIRGLEFYDTNPWPENYFD